MTILINMLKEKFDIDHATIELEDEGHLKAAGEYWRQGKNSMIDHCSPDEKK